MKRGVGLIWGANAALWLLCCGASSTGSRPHRGSGAFDAGKSEPSALDASLDASVPVTPPEALTEAGSQAEPDPPDAASYPLEGGPGPGTGADAGSCLQPDQDWALAAADQWVFTQTTATLPGRWLSTTLRLAVTPELLAVAGTVAIAESGPNFADGSLWLSSQSGQGTAIGIGGADDVGFPDSLFALTENDAGFVLGGRLCEETAFDAADPTTPAPVGCVDAFIGQYGWDGQPLWHTMLGGPGRAERVSSVAAAADGIVYASGQYDVGAQVNGEPISSRAAPGLFLAQLRDGVPQWVRTFVGLNDGPVVAALAEGGAVVAGHRAFDVPAGAPTPKWSSSPYIRRYSLAGELEWEKTIASEAGLFSVKLANDGGIVVSGSFWHQLDLTALGGPSYCEGSESQAAYVLKLDADGNHSWSQAWGSPAGATSASHVSRIGEALGISGIVHVNTPWAGFDEGAYGYLRIFDLDGAVRGQVLSQNEVIADAALGASGDVVTLVRGLDVESFGEASVIALPIELRTLAPNAP